MSPYELSNIYMLFVSLPFPCILHSFPSPIKTFAHFPFITLVPRSSYAQELF